MTPETVIVVGDPVPDLWWAMFMLDPVVEIHGVFNCAYRFGVN